MTGRLPASHVIAACRGRGGRSTAFAGWLHYCTFDPLIGLGIVLDARKSGVPHLLCIPCLIATALAGPVGFASYMLLRTIFGALRKTSTPPPKGFAWGKTF